MSTLNDFPPGVAMLSKLRRRVFRAKWMARIEMACFSMAPEAKHNRIVGSVWPTVSFLDDVMNIGRASSKLMAHTAASAGLYENFISNCWGKSHVVL